RRFEPPVRRGGRARRARARARPRTAGSARRPGPDAAIDRDGPVRVAGARGARGTRGRGRAAARSGGLRGRQGVAGSRGPRPDRRGAMDPVTALERGLPVLLPTDTVYGLVSTPGEEAARTLYALKGRARAQPTALLAATVEALLEAVPELDASLLRRLLPGPYTLVVPNPAARF